MITEKNKTFLAHFGSSENVGDIIQDAKDTFKTHDYDLYNGVLHNPHTSEHQLRYVLPKDPREVPVYVARRLIKNENTPKEFLTHFLKDPFYHLTDHGQTKTLMDHPKITESDVSHAIDNGIFFHAMDHGEMISAIKHPKVSDDAVTNLLKKEENMRKLLPYADSDFQKNGAPLLKKEHFDFAMKHENPSIRKLAIVYNPYITKDELVHVADHDPDELTRYRAMKHENFPMDKLREYMKVDDETKSYDATQILGSRIRRGEK